MITKILHRSVVFSMLAAVWITAACSHVDLDFTISSESGRTENETDRVPNKEFRNVFIVYSMGFNNLTRYLSEDVEDLIASPLMSNPRDVLLIFSHRAEWPTGDRYPAYGKPTSPTLTRISKDDTGMPIRDTLLVLPDTLSSADAGTLNKILTYVNENFDADGYGMLMSSHGTGWVPEDYCNHPYNYDEESSSGIWRVQTGRHVIPKPFDNPYLRQDGSPAVKSIGVQNITTSKVKEMNITDIVKAIPMKLDFIIFDACFMGGIEVAYQFRDICDKMVFSQTEILADGMDYTTMLSYVFKGMAADLVGFCDNYYEFYDKRNGDYRSATISLIDCTRLEPLADICRLIFTEHRDKIAELEGNRTIQRYYRNQYAEYHQWFFDLYDIATRCGASSAQISALDNALNGCIIYKAATPSVLGIPIKVHSGLSMYLPYKNRTYLNTFYKSLDWNISTGLVQ